MRYDMLAVECYMIHDLAKKEVVCLECKGLMLSEIEQGD